MESAMNRKNVGLVAQAFADYCSESGYSAVVIGYDGRNSSADFATAFANVIQSNGLMVTLSDQVVPTPVVSFYCSRNVNTAGVMITASHNPPQYNGIKFKTVFGSPFGTDQTAHVEQLIGNNQVKANIPRPVVRNILQPYLDNLSNRFNFEAMRQAGLRIAIDSMHGAGGYILENLLVQNGIKANTISAEALTDFGGRQPEPIMANLEPLSRCMKNQNFSLGVATDGDADRLGVLDNNGQYVNIQYVILAFAEYLKLQLHRKGPLVKTASVTDKLLMITDEVVDVQVGFKYVAEAMTASKACFGAEESGGFGFEEHIPDRDGIYSALLMGQMLAESGFSDLKSFLNELIKRYGIIYYNRIDLHITDKARNHVLPLLMNNPLTTFGGFETKAVLHYANSRGIVNGLKIRLEGQNRWILIRVSETEPVVRIYAEGQSDGEVQHLLTKGMYVFLEVMKSINLDNQ